MDSDRPLHPHNHNHQHYQQQQQQTVSSGLMRYRSAPSSYFANLMDNSLHAEGENCDELILNPRHSSPEAQRILSSFISSSEDSFSHSLRDIRGNAAANEALQPQSQFPVPTKQETDIFGHNQQQQQHQQQNSNYSSAPQMIYQNSAASNSGIDNSYSMDSLPQMKHGGGGHGGRGGGSSNLIRQSSSPAGLFSHINIENGYGVMRGMGSFGSGNGTNAEASFPSPSGLKGQMDFSSGPPPSSLRRMTPILENRSKSMEITGFPISSWDDSAIISDSFLERLEEEDDDKKIFSALNSASENQNAEGGNRPPAVLSHHLSLPTSSAELSAMQKLLQFQDSVPCKIRAKRGFATHPRSIAERVRRTRISERMRKLQELVPNMDKQTNTADMLDLAVDYIKDLQSEVKALQDNRAKCTCSKKQRQ